MSLVPAESPGDVVFATPDAVDEIVATFPAADTMPADVAALLDLAHKLLRTSVVHYEFAALAVEKSLQAVERAVRARLGVVHTRRRSTPRQRRSASRTHKPHGSGPTGSATTPSAPTRSTDP